MEKGSLNASVSPAHVSRGGTVRHTGLTPPAAQVGAPGQATGMNTAAAPGGDFVSCVGWERVRLLPVGCPEWPVSPTSHPPIISSSCIDRDL